MREIRIGNDLCVRWEIITNGEKKSLSDRDLRLFLWHNNGRQEITDFSTHGNILEWIFRGTQQKRTGEYTLTLCENKDKVGMATIDEKGFRLVARMYGTNGLTEPEELQLETASFTSSAAPYPVATEDMDGLMPKEDKRLVNAYRAALEELTDERIHNWFYNPDADDFDSENPAP